MSEYYNDSSRYDDIINLKRPQSDRHVSMPLHHRAAQFAPFAALTGHDEAIKETARITDKKIILDESEVERINEKLHEISQDTFKKREVSITYFKPDKLKKGGAYLTDVGIIKKIDPVEKVVVMNSGMRICMEHIIDISVCDI